MKRTKIVEESRETNGIEDQFVKIERLPIISVESPTRPLWFSVQPICSSISISSITETPWERYGSAIDFTHLIRFIGCRRCDSWGKSAHSRSWRVRIYISILVSSIRVISDTVQRMNSLMLLSPSTPSNSSFDLLNRSIIPSPFHVHFSCRYCSACPYY